MSIELIITGILIILGLFGGGVYLAKLKVTIIDFRDLLNEVIDALEDNKITSEEWGEIVLAFKKIINNWGDAKQRKTALNQVKEVNKNRRKRKLG